MELAELAKKLDISLEEAKSLQEFDKQVDKMKMSEVNADLSEKQKAVLKSAKQADRAPTVYKFEKRERKANNAKRELIELIAESVGKVANNLEIINAEREMVFYFNEVKYKIVLSAPRS